MFSKFGEVADVHLPRDKNFVFVRFGDEKEAEEAADEMDGKELYGGEIKCVLATKRKKGKNEYKGYHNSSNSYDERRGGRSRSRRRRDDSSDRRDRGGKRNDSR